MYLRSEYWWLAGVAVEQPANVEAVDRGTLQVGHSLSNLEVGILLPWELGRLVKGQWAFVEQQGQSHLLETLFLLQEAIGIASLEMQVGLVAAAVISARTPVGMAAQMDRMGRTATILEELGKGIQIGLRY